MKRVIEAAVTEGFENLSALRSEWNDLFHARHHEPSLSFEWTMAMVRNHVRPSDRCLLVSLRRDGRTHGLIPLVVRRLTVLGQPMHLLAPLSEEYNTHSDLLVRSADAPTMSAFVRALMTVDARWDYFRMARLLEDSPTARAMREVLSAGTLTHSVHEGIAAYVLPLPDSFDGYLAARTAKFRNHLKRSQRKLANAGALSTQEVDGSGNSLDAGLDALMRIEHASWKHEHGSAISAVEHQTGFYRQFCLGAHEEGRLHLQWLTIDGQPVAYNLGYLQGDHYHYLKTSYDQSLRELSPSTVLRARLIESLIGRGLKVFDFPGEPYEWETQWTDTVRWRQVLTIYGATVRGRLLRLAERIRHRARGKREVRHVDARASRPKPRPSR